MFRPFGQWLPDQPAHLNEGALVALNVIPRARSYGPVKALSAFSGALIGGTARGATFMRGSDGTVQLFVGTPTTLERLSASMSGAFEDVSQAAYTLPAGDLWSFAVFGDRVVAANLAVAPQSYVIGSSTDFADLAAAAPRAKIAATVRDFLFLGNTWDAVDGFKPNRIWWSGSNDPDNWPTPGTNPAAQVQSDFQDFPDGGAVQAIVPGLLGADAIVIQERSVRHLTHVGPREIFKIIEVQGGRGTLAPNSVIRVGGRCFYLGLDGFCACDGVNTTPIGDERINDYFFSTVAGNAVLPLMTATYDARAGVIMWAYHTASAMGNPDRQIIYSPRADKWSEAAFPCQGLVNAGLTFGYTLEDLDAFGALDDLPFSLDSVVWQGGEPVPAAFDTSGKLAFFTGSNLAATIDTGELARDDGRRIFIRGVRPNVDGGTVTAAILHRATPGAALTTDAATAPAADGMCKHRRSTRFARARVSIAAAGTWTHAHGVEPDIEAEGYR